MAGFEPLLLDEGEAIKAYFKVFNGGFEMFYKEPTYPPQINRPDYGRWFYYCGSCGKGYYIADKCPCCGAKTRKVQEG